MTTSSPLPTREVVLGRSSTVWQRLSADPALARLAGAAIGHHDVAGFAFTPADRVWVLSYSRDPRENAAMLQRLHAAGVREIVYITSASTIITSRTRCYEYPRVKWLAEQEALTLPQAKLLTIGLMHDSVDELPSGTNIATRYSELAEFMQRPEWPDSGGRGKRLFHVEQRPFGSALERLACTAYTSLLMAAGSRPCLLRPLDLILRLLGWRWYGYTCLSNRLWTSKTS